MGGGGLIQLVAAGAQDVYLTGNPQITFFRTVYRRHTNFALETIQNTFVGGASFGGRVSLAISRTADLVSKTYVRVVISGATAPCEGKWAWVPNLGHALLESVELTIGGQRVDYHTSDWYQLWNELTKQTTQERGYNNLIGNTTALTTLANSHTDTVLYIPLQFFFCRHVGQALPLIALQYHEVKIDIQFAQLNNLLISTGFAPGTDVGSQLGLKIVDATIECGMIYLDTDERRRFAQSSHEILIEQVQYTGAESARGTKATQITMNHPVKELIWGVHTGRMANVTGSYKYLWYHPSDLDAMRLIATKRFVLALAKYSGDDIVLNNTDTDTNSILPQTGLTGDLLTMFNNIKAAGVSTSASVDNVAILGDLLTLEDISTPVSVLFNGINRPLNGHGSTLYDVVVRMPHNFGVYIDGSVNPLKTAKIMLNGQDRIKEQDAAFFNYLQPYEHHTRTPADGINVYSFAISPEEQQPSGTLNFSRIDMANLLTTLDSKYPDEVGHDSTLVVYGFSYNVLRIMSGMGGLAFSS
jgi:hypothetical protein